MDGGIYFDNDGELIEMTEDLYDREALLQRDLADFPKLLAGDQMDVANPRRWMLIAREASVPDKKGGNERWSADHLFVDQDAIPTIVEVKRSTDTRGRREVAGQMLDYVSHATLYWEAEGLRDTFRDTCEDRDVSSDQVLAEFLEDDQDEIDGFWNRVEANLRSGNVRLLFVADEIPSELKRIVEFLNEQMATAEVLAVEVTPYTSGDQTAYVPRLYGQTEEARQSKQSTTRPDHDEDDFLEDVALKEQEGTLAPEAAIALRDLYDFVCTEADSYDFGGTANVSVTARWEALGGSSGMFTLNSKGEVVFWQPAYLHNNNKADWPRDALVTWYEALSEMSHEDADVARFEDTETSLPIEAFVDEEDRSQFKRACLEFSDAVAPA
jgi:hypothetical protein